MKKTDFSSEGCGYGSGFCRKLEVYHIFMYIFSFVDDNEYIYLNQETSRPLSVYIAQSHFIMYCCNTISAHNDEPEQKAGNRQATNGK